MPPFCRPAVAQWYVASVEPGREYRARDALRRAGIAVFLPTEERVIFRHRVMCSSKVPLIPTYVFVHAVMDDAVWSVINTTPFVMRILCGTCGWPVPIAAEFVTRIVADLDAKGVIRTVWREGDRLRLIGGPYEGHEGIYQMCAKDRITLLLDTLGRSVQIEVPDKFVAAAS